MLSDVTHLIPDTHDHYKDGDIIVNSTGVNFKLLLAISIEEMSLKLSVIEKLRTNNIVNLGSLLPNSREELYSLIGSENTQFIESQLTATGLALGSNFCPSLTTLKEIRKTDLTSGH